MPAWRVCALLAMAAAALAAFEGAAAHGGPAARGLLQGPNSSEFQVGARLAVQWRTLYARMSSQKSAVVCVWT